MRPLYKLWSNIAPAHTDPRRRRSFPTGSGVYPAADTADLLECDLFVRMGIGKKFENAYKCSLEIKLLKWLSRKQI